MPFVILRLPCFEKQLQRALKRHKKSIPHVNKIIEGLAVNRQSGDVYPGFAPLSVRKLRLGLPEYRIGQRRGLRLLFLTVPDRNKVIPLAIYRKKLFTKESDVKDLVKGALRALEHELYDSP